LGYRMAPSITNDVLAYIGAVGIVFVFLRLLSAPYFIWREQVGEIGSLKLELTRPERLELEHLSKIRAKARAQMASIMRKMHWYAFGKDAENANEIVSACYEQIIDLSASAGCSHGFEIAVGRLYDLITECCEQGDNEDRSDKLFDLDEMLTDYLHGRITGEALALRLPKDIEPEKQP
jgi:hypothetical protein